MLELSSNKNALRRSVLEQLRAIPDDVRAERSARLREQIHPILGKTPRTVAIYAPLPHEVDFMPLLSEQPWHRYLFPRCGTHRRMEFHHVTTPAEQLIPGAMNIMAPRKEQPIIPPEEIEIIIVPGVAFTATGRRLGYGGGYYDTYLPRCPQATLLAAAFPEQILVHLPKEAHDITIPSIITLT